MSQEEGKKVLLASAQSHPVSMRKKGTENFRNLKLIGKVRVMEALLKINKEDL